MSSRLRGFVAALLLAPASCAAPPSTGGRVVVASIGPLADWARHVAGPGWQVVCVLPPAASPHTYELKPADVARFQGALLWLSVGAGLDPFMERLTASSGGKNVFVLTRGFQMVDGNPHVWLDPAVARAALDRLAVEFSRLDPADSAGYRGRALAYGASIDSLDREYREAALHFRVRSFVGFHDAWGYLARRYGLVQAGSVEPAPGREPGPADWGNLVRAIRASGSRAVFTEPQFGTRLPAALAGDAGVKLLVLDPVGTTGEAAGENYVALMRRNLAALREGLQ